MHRKRRTPHLSPREQQIVHMIINARPIKEIAAELHLTGNTVSQYLADLYAKLGIHSRAELALWGIYEEMAEREKRDKVA
jgi:DNA-binding CsgD family transcriptional regulator